MDSFRSVVINARGWCLGETVHRRDFLKVTGLAIAVPSLSKLTTLYDGLVFFAPFNKNMPKELVGVSPLYTSLNCKCFDGPLTIEMVIKAWKKLDD